MSLLVFFGLPILSLLIYSIFSLVVNVKHGARLQTIPGILLVCSGLLIFSGLDFSISEMFADSGLFDYIFLLALLLLIIQLVNQKKFNSSKGLHASGAITLLVITILVFCLATPMVLQNLGLIG